MSCNYRNREDEIVAYLYDELEPEPRLVFEAHLESCASCRNEIASLRAIRKPLASWIPPEPARALEYAAVPAPPKPSVWTSLSNIPAWAQVAAATLFLGVAVGVANLHIRYDQQGLSITTGWMPRAPQVEAPSNDEPWRTELAALQEQFRSELAAARTSAPADPPDVTPSVASVRAMVAASEQRQQRELALRMQTLMRDVDVQRQADHERIDFNLGIVGAQVFDLRDYIIQTSIQR